MSAGGGFGGGSATSVGVNIQPKTIHDDGTGHINFITALDQYAGRCADEIRWEDYQKVAGPLGPLLRSFFTLLQVVVAHLLEAAAATIP